MKALIIEQDPDISGALKTILQDLGWEVKIIDSFFRALVMLGRERYEIVLVDHYLLKRDGACSFLDRIPVHTVVLSSLREVERKQLGSRAKILVKPFSLDDFLRAIPPGSTTVGVQRQ